MFTCVCVGRGSTHAKVWALWRLPSYTPAPSSPPNLRGPGELGKLDPSLPAPCKVGCAKQMLASLPYGARPN